MPDLKVRAPTPEECNTNAAIDVGDKCQAIAAWYPQMGGYAGKCVVLRMAECFDVFVWHDGEFPFDESGSPGRPPAELHHCDPEQFIKFGMLVQARLFPERPPTVQRLPRLPVRESGRCFAWIVEEGEATGRWHDFEPSSAAELHVGERMSAGFVPDEEAVEVNVREGDVVHEFDVEIHVELKADKRSGLYGPSVPRPPEGGVTVERGATVTFDVTDGIAEPTAPRDDDE